MIALTQARAAAAVAASLSVSVDRFVLITFIRAIVLLGQPDQSVCRRYIFPSDIQYKPMYHAQHLPPHSVRSLAE